MAVGTRKAFLNALSGIEIASLEVAFCRSFAKRKLIKSTRDSSSGTSGRALNNSLCDPRVDSSSCSVLGDNIKDLKSFM
jgi:hypothetical protein